MTTLTDALVALDAFNATLSEDNEDTPETLAEQERLMLDVARAEAADLQALSAKQLTAHYAARCDGKQPPKGLAKAALIARINSLPPLPAPTTAEVDTAKPQAEFSVAAYARAHGVDGRELRKQLRAAGLRAPYALVDVEKVALSS